MNDTQMFLNGRIVSTPDIENRLDCAKVSQLTALQQGEGYPEGLPVSCLSATSLLEEDCASLPIKVSDVDGSLACLEQVVDNSSDHAAFEASKPDKKRNRMTQAQLDALKDGVTKNYMEGLPNLETMLQYGLSQTQLETIQNRLFREKRITARPPAYEVVRCTTSIKKPLCINENWTYIKIEKLTDNGSYVLTEYKRD